MLESLYIENFAIITKLNINFENSMTVLTGETGAGKSIIIDAIGQLCGGRSDSGLIREGAQKAVIEGIFSTQSEAVKDFFAEYDLDYERTDCNIQNNRSLKQDNLQIELPQCDANFDPQTRRLSN